MLKKKDIHLKQMTIKEKIEKMVEEVKEEDIQVSKEENRTILLYLFEKKR